MNTDDPAFTGVENSERPKYELVAYVKANTAETAGRRQRI